MGRALPGKSAPAAAARSDKGLHRELRDLMMAAREGVARQVNEALVTLYWEIGKRVHMRILQTRRAQYGDQMVATLARPLSAEFGDGFSVRNLWYMIRFAETFGDENIVNALRSQWGWTHFRRLIGLELEKSGIRVASYWLDQIPRKLLEKKLHEAIRLARGLLDAKGASRA